MAEPLAVPWGKRVKAELTVRVEGVGGLLDVRARMLNRFGHEVGKLWNAPPKGVPWRPEVAGLKPSVSVEVLPGDSVTVVVYTPPLAGKEAVAFPIRIEWTVRLLEPGSGRLIAEQRVVEVDPWRIVGEPEIQVRPPAFSTG